MPLSYDLNRQSDELVAERIAHYGTPEANASMNYIMSIATALVGIGDLSEANAGEFFARVTLFEKVTEPLRYIEGQPVPLTAEDVRLYVGMSTNVSPISRTQFVKTQLAKRLDELARDYSQASTPAAAELNG